MAGNAFPFIFFLDEFVCNVYLNRFFSSLNPPAELTFYTPKEVACATVDGIPKNKQYVSLPWFRRIYSLLFSKYFCWFYLLLTLQCEKTEHFTQNATIFIFSAFCPNMCKISFGKISNQMLDQQITNQSYDQQEYPIWTVSKCCFFAMLLKKITLTYYFEIIYSIILMLFLF